MYERTARIGRCHCTNYSYIKVSFHKPELHMYMYSVMCTVTVDTYWKPKEVSIMQYTIYINGRPRATTCMYSCMYCMYAYHSGNVRQTLVPKSQIHQRRECTVWHFELYKQKRIRLCIIIRLLSTGMCPSRPIQ